MHLEASFFKSARIRISLYLTIFWDSCFSAWLSSSTLTSAHSNTPTTTTMSPLSLRFCVPPPSAIWGFGIHEKPTGNRGCYIYYKALKCIYYVPITPWYFFFFFKGFWCGTQSLRNTRQALTTELYPIVDTFPPTLLKTPTEEARAVQMGAAREGQPLQSGRTCQGLLLGYIPDLHSPASCAHQNTI